MIKKVLDSLMIKKKLKKGGPCFCKKKNESIRHAMICDEFGDPCLI